MFPFVDEGDPDYIYIVALTAYTTDGFEKKCMANGMDSYLSKPVTGEKLKEVIEHVGIM